MNQLAANLVDHVLPAVPVRHWVMSFPMNVRFLLAWRPQLRKEVMAAWTDVVLGWLRKRVGGKCQGGAVAVWQLSGSALNVNPHIHAILLDGSYVWDERRGAPVFRRARPPTQRVMERLVRQIHARVEALLERWGLLEHVDLDDVDGQVELQLGSVQGRGCQRRRTVSARPAQRRGGLFGWDAYYDLHTGRPIPGEDRAGIERLAKYIGRPAVSPKRLSVLGDGRIRLGLRRAWADGTTGFVFQPIELLRRVAAIVVPPRVHLVHYFGVLAPHARWRSLVVPHPEEPEPKRCGEPERKRCLWIPWAELLYRTFGVSTCCDRCGGEMRVRAVVQTNRRLPRRSLGMGTGPPLLPTGTRRDSSQHC